jgi:quercetin dioxygenase-like cupin family protein
VSPADRERGGVGPARAPDVGGEQRVVVLDASEGAAVEIVDEGGRAHAIVWPGMGARLRSMQRISLEPKGRTVPMTHPSEAVYYVISGSGIVRDGSNASTETLVEGSMAHVDPGTPYVLCAGSEGLELVGGPAPADPALYESLGREG